MIHVVRWGIVVLYLIPMIGTIVAMGRRGRSVWTFGRGLRARIPDNPISRQLKRWSHAIRMWWARQALGQRLSVRRVNAEFGRIEYLIGHLRDYTIGVVMMGGVVYNLTMCLLMGPDRLINYFYDAVYFGVFAGLSLTTYRRHVTTGLKMTEFLRANPHVHPQEFFDHYYRHLGPLNEPIPVHAEVSVNPEDVSYRSGGEAQLGYGRLFYGLYDTAIFARSSYKALDTIGAEYGRAGFDVWSSLWGSRMIQLFRSDLKVKGADKFKELDGKIILVCNHKSHLDFVFNFFALSKTHLKDGRAIRPRYMAAKDHFIDNKFVYEGLGVGRLIENVDMVFVDRTGKGADAIQQAAEVLVKTDVSIAMYPQGTRAYGNLGWQRERRDAGFYTTGSARRLKERLGHLRKGCAHLLLDTAMALHREKRETPVHLVFIGIEGTANLVPKGSFKVRTESEVTFTVGDVYTIYPHEVDGFEKPPREGPQRESQRLYHARVNEVMEAINDGLVKALDLHRKLIDRFIADVREKKLAPSDNWLLIKNHLTAFEQKGMSLPFEVIDRIYALDPSYWTSYLKELAEIFAVENPSFEVLQTLNEAVIDFLLQTRGKLMKKALMGEKEASKKARKAS